MLEILKMPYCSGGYTESKHEEALEKLLNKHGFKLNNSKISEKDRDESMKTNKLSCLQNNEYLSQPCGKNDSPDFIVKHNDKLYFIECKSVNSGSRPMYNGGLPKDKYIYILSSNKYKETTVFYGHHVVTEKMRKLYDEYLSKIYKIEKELVNLLENIGDANPLGISYYVRDMYTHKGKKNKTNYFRNAERYNFEQDVLNSLR